MVFPGISRLIWIHHLGLLVVWSWIAYWVSPQAAALRSLALIAALLGRSLLGRLFILRVRGLLTRLGIGLGIRLLVGLSVIDIDLGSLNVVIAADIADIDIGKNIGAALQIDQAQADKNIAQAKAEERRAMAIALEQEMKAKAQEARAKVIEAEAELPRAMAEAFINGNLGIMDYYKMKNMEADTTMRESIARPGATAATPKK